MYSKRTVVVVFTVIASGMVGGACSSDDASTAKSNGLPGGPAGASANGGDGGVATDAGSLTGGSTSDSGPPNASGCIQNVFNDYLLRNDGILVTIANETPVLDASTGQPLRNVVSAMSSNEHGCANTSDGSVYCWQSNASANGNFWGQLGDGTMMQSSASFRANRVLTKANTPLTGVVAMAATDGGAESSCAITGDGTLFCWGDGRWLFNNGTDVSMPYAQKVTKDGLSPLANVKQAAFSPTHACAVIGGETTNEAWCWGSGDNFQLGTGDNADHQYPAKVIGLLAPTQVSIASINDGEQGTTCAIDGGGVRCWGSNYQGACGTNTDETAASTCMPSPVVTGTSGTALDGAVKIVGGYGDGGRQLTCVVRTDKTIWCWPISDNGYATEVDVVTSPPTPEQGNVIALADCSAITADGLYHEFCRGTSFVPACQQF